MRLNILDDASLTADDLRAPLLGGRMATQRQYMILLYPDPEQGGYWVRVPALKGCYSQGDTLEAAITHAREAIALYLGLAAAGEPIPEEPDHPQAVVIDVGDVAA